MAKTKPAKQKVVEQKFFLKLPEVWLAVLCLLVYGKAITLGFTELDDQIFIKDNYEYNSKLSNIVTSFSRGVFTVDKDIYYRPVLLVDFIIESQLFGDKITGYHFTNIFFHILAVVLLFWLLLRLKIPEHAAFAAACIFAVHPVLGQAVVWIPGRNDILLCILLLSSFIFYLRYLNSAKNLHLLAVSVFFLLALFTKETALLFPVAMFTYVAFFNVYAQKKQLVLQSVALVVVALLIYFIVKSTATLLSGQQGLGSLVSLITYRLPLLPQYIGKIFIPVNLSVYPLMEDTSTIFGLVAMGLLVAAIIFTKAYKNPKALWGLCWFILFLIPVLLIPKQANNQAYEHRLYVPLIGLLIAGGFVYSGKFTVPTPGLKYGFTALVVLFAAISFYRIGYFYSPLTFWQRAVHDSPHSATAKRILGRSLHQLGRKEESMNAFLEAYKLNENEEHLNISLAGNYFALDSFEKAEFHARKEWAISNSEIASRMLADLMFRKGNKAEALVYLQNAVNQKTTDTRTYENLTMLYIEFGKLDKAKSVVQVARQNGVVLSPQVVNAVGF